MERNKIIYGGVTLIDLTDATATASDIASGKTAYGADGSLLTGTNENSEWTSGIYMDEDGYIRVSPDAGAGGVYCEGGYIVFGDEPDSELPDGDDIGYGLYEPPRLVSLNGHWDFDAEDTIDVTDGNHFVVTTHRDWAGGGTETITRSDGKPWFGFNDGIAEVIIKPNGTSTLETNGRISFFTEDGETFWMFGPGYNSNTTGSTKTINEPTEIYGIGISRYWKGTTDMYIEIYLNCMRIV